MRRVRLSRTFRDQLDELIEQGFPRFGTRVVTEKRERLLDLIHNHLAAFPRNPRDPDLGLCVYPVSQTPFVLIYDFDDVELRIHFVMHGADDRRRLDPNSAEW